MPTETHQHTAHDWQAGLEIGVLRAWAYGFMVGTLTLITLLLRIGFRLWEIPAAVAAGGAGAGGGWLISEIVAHGSRHILTSGSSTPYAEQFSLEDSLIVRGEVDEALRSFESTIAAQPAAIAARIRAAELCVKQGNHPRAAELFSDALRVPSITAGEDVYVSNRLADLLMGPLDEPGRALVMLRRLIERHPDSTAAKHARVALSTVKERLKAPRAEG